MATRSPREGHLALACSCASVAWFRGCVEPRRDRGRSDLPRCEEAELAAALEGLGFDLRQPPLDLIARWGARGPTAYDAAYVALAETEATRLITDDSLILDVAAKIAVALADARG